MDIERLEEIKTALGALEFAMEMFRHQSAMQHPHIYRAPDIIRELVAEVERLRTPRYIHVVSPETVASINEAIRTRQFTQGGDDDDGA